MIAHEVGHIEHYDFALMALAALVPLLLYQLYVFTRRAKNGGLIAYSAYLCRPAAAYCSHYVGRAQYAWRCAPLNFLAAARFGCGAAPNRRKTCLPSPCWAQTHGSGERASKQQQFSVRLEFLANHKPVSTTCRR